jgi:hypothetical protein
MTTTAVSTSTTPAPILMDTLEASSSSSNVVALRPTAQTATAAAPAAADPLQSARARAYESIAKFVDDSNVRIAKYDEQREAALAVLREPAPEPPMKMSDAEWKGFIIQKAIAMQHWDSGANDRGGKNDRESNALNQVDSTLTTNAKYMSYEDAIAMLEFASGRSSKLGQGLQGTHLQNSGGTFEDGGWQNVFNAVRSMSVAAQTEHEGQVAAWKQRQATAKLELANVTNLLGATQSNLGNTVVAFNDMMQKDAHNQAMMMSQRMQTLPSFQPKVDMGDNDVEEKGFEAITVTVNNPINNANTNARPGSPMNVKVTVNIDPDFNMSRTLAARSDPINVSARFAQG